MIRINILIKKPAAPESERFWPEFARRAFRRMHTKTLPCEYERSKLRVPTAEALRHTEMYVQPSSGLSSL